ncbi:MAG: hypothetical protein FJ139_11845 [Deltaproteobacteria bacterium]|nr:hypothetical protein [Deltaproteobacteria bacterium]
MKFAVMGTGGIGGYYGGLLARTGQDVTFIARGAHLRRIALGELDGRTTPRLQAVYDALQKAGMTVEISDNILKVLWAKFVFIAPVMLMGESDADDFRRLPGRTGSAGRAG